METKRAEISRSDSCETSSSRPTIRVNRLGRLACEKLAAAAVRSLLWSRTREIGATKQ